jgi:hypothetical protein
MKGARYLKFAGAMAVMAAAAAPAPASEIVLHNCLIHTGSNPYAGVIRDSAGNLYGTTDIGRRGGLWRGVQARYHGPGDGAAQLHGRG